jgi:hypothetical protein
MSSPADILGTIAKALRLRLDIYTGQPANIRLVIAPM